MLEQRIMEQLFRQNYSEMIHLARVLLSNDEEAGDVVQDIFLRVASSDMPPKNGSYLLTAVRNACLNRIRQMQLHERVKNLMPIEEEADLQPTDKQLERLEDIAAYVDEHHTFGAKYEYSFPTRMDETTTSASDITTNGQFYDKWGNKTGKQSRGKAAHTLNAYYAGNIGRLYVDWNFDFLRSGYDEQSRIAETCLVQEDRTLSAENRVRNRMLASKLTMSYPLLGGSLDCGAEYTNTNRQDDYVEPQHYVASTYSTLKEQSISPYVEYSRLLPKVGQFRIGLRYEHVDFDYYESGQLIEGQSRSYSNVYPSLSFATQLGKVQAQVAYSTKTLTGELNFRYQGLGHYQNVYLDYHQTVLNVSLVKTFIDGRLSIKLAGEDLLDRSRDGNLVYNHQVRLWQGNYYDRRRFVATVRYKFNTTKSKYKGTGAGNEEKSRL